MTRRLRSRKVWRWLILFLLVAVILVIRLVEEPGRDAAPDDRFVIVGVVDGDTVELKGGDRLRLLALDTPERGEAYYAEATALLRRVALGKKARLAYGQERRDRYGRLLGFLYIDTVLVNQILIDSGMGYLYLFKDIEMSRPEVGQMLTAQRQAIDARRGLWSLDREKEPYYVASVNSFRLHRPGCRSAEGFKEGNYRRFETREEGLKEGLSPCRNCRP